MRSDGLATREAILAAAELEFAAKGYYLASAREICRVANVNSALLSRYFTSKEALYRIVAKRLFGELGAPLASLWEKVVDEESWRAALYEWVDDMLFMTLPTERTQEKCAALFRHEVTCPSEFYDEFKEAFGRPVYYGLRKILSMKVKDEEKLELLASSIWAQVSVYALVDKRWHGDFRPCGAGNREWAGKVARHICEGVCSLLEDVELEDQKGLSLFQTGECPQDFASADGECPYARKRI